MLPWSILVYSACVININDVDNRFFGRTSFATPIPSYFEMMQQPCKSIVVAVAVKLTGVTQLSLRS